MGQGIVEPTQAVVPGTIQLYDNDEEGAVTTIHLKHAPDGKTVLAPQPSDSPNDPLNWSTWRKDFVFIILLVSAICSGVHGPMVAPITLTLASDFNVSINDVAQLSSYMLLVIGGMAYIDSALANVYGKRPVFVFALVLLVVSDAWASRAESYGSLMGARCLSGAGQAAFEAISLSVVPDLYFVHQRNRRVALFILLFQTGVYLGVPLATQVYVSSGQWRTEFWALAVTEGIMLILFVLFFWEPAYKRYHVDPLAHQSESIILDQMNDPKAHAVHVMQTGHKESTGQDSDNMERVNTAALEQPNTFWQNLKLYNGRFSHNNPIMLIYRALALTFHPTVFWCGSAGLLMAWPVGVSFTIDAFMTLPPYNFSATGVANMVIQSWRFLIVVHWALDCINYCPCGWRYNFQSPYTFCHSS
jgi:Major Facilitator Superfamily